MDKNIPKPVRVQRQRTKGWKMPENTIYVGRPTKWGNPFKIGEVWADTYPPVETNQEAIDLFQHYTLPKIATIKDLKGKNLACWCPLDKPCHADILLKIANRD